MFTLLPKSFQSQSSAAVTRQEDVLRHRGQTPQHPGRQETVLTWWYYDRKMQLAFTIHCWYQIS